MIKTIDEIQNEVIEEFALLTEWMDKYNYLIELGRSIPLIDSKLKNEDHLIRGCQSRVWLEARFEDDKIFFTGDSDAIITKGIAALLIRVMSGHTPEEILNTELFFISEIGLKENLSPTRSNGMTAMLRQMKYYALAYQAKNKPNHAD
ncbi:MAG: SufE family protein [Bacteroidales bacterium]|nr:SufE family protein [Bacteroidales bacterium]